MIFRKIIFLGGLFGVLLVLVFLFLHLDDISLINFTDTAQYSITSERKTSSDLEFEDSYIFYYLYCGTACQGFRVRNTDTGASYSGVLSYVYNNESLTYDTVLQDWFGRVYKIDGQPDIEVDYYKGHIIISFNKVNITDGKTIITEKERIVIPIKSPKWQDLWGLITI